MTDARANVTITVGPCRAEEALVALRAFAGGGGAEKGAEAGSSSRVRSAVSPGDYTVPRPESKWATELLEHAPRGLHHLADWFGQLSSEQLRAVWIPAVLDAVLEDRVVSPAALDRALLVVKKRVCGAAAAELRQEEEAERRVVDGGRPGETVVDRLLRLCRENDGEIVVKDHFAKQQRAYLKRVVDGDSRLEWLAGQSGAGKRPAKVRLVGATRGDEEGGRNAC